MPKPFNASQFAATKFNTAEEKAKWANDLMAFVESGFKPSKWTKALYQRLSKCFMHIAHYDMGGFWDVWFSTPHNQWRWITHIMRGPYYGDPQFTFSDVEKAIASYLTENPGILTTIANRASDAARADDEAEYARLGAKLGKAPH